MFSQTDVPAPASSSAAAKSPSSYPLIVHSHLCWDWVWQRPQQFLSRLSRRHEVLFVEGPVSVSGLEASYSTRRHFSNFPNITVFQTFIPDGRWHDGHWVDGERHRLLREALAGPLKGRFDGAVQWFYDPMAVTAFAGRMNESAIVYDCMDELSQFKGAPPALVERERDLLRVADVVFAGGRKMHESKSRFNANCHFYGCGVDVEHFGRARDAKTSVPDDMAALSGPTLGYFGVVDERLDYELLAKLADADPDWNIVMVGPMTKIDPAIVPQRPNLHWLGGREYSRLPAYAKGFDVCLMPFARNEATEYINPTKALEYMATARPIVSSDVPDVVSNFSSVVGIARSHDEFIALCRTALQSPDQQAVARGVQMAEDNTWDAIVAKLEAHIDDVLAARAAAQDTGGVTAQAVASRAVAPVARPAVRLQKPASAVHVSTAAG